MKRHLLTYITLMLSLVIAAGCSSSSTSNGVEEHSNEALEEALLRHPDFPALQGSDEEAKIVQTQSAGKLDTTFSSDVKVENKDNSYIIYLQKTWEQDGQEYKNYWKYEYDPDREDLKLMEHQVEDRQMSTI
ncbi:MULTISPECIES: hypothetical protein [Pontibacillus]|uniref:Lipoprotein n=1 Tax=Pontibacillus chungwhensis TaxID=265426 RepID=A0ABY8UVT8_9BACI|nr:MULTISPECIES: hypothetical protein [Pontibacillus]MCD5325289.1 hypothetical protein [Pontibacillus sp. HN14]WIF97533.1 hypothetical protein QNI29_17640 [Pontibacillus chungwhensis]